MLKIKQLFFLFFSMGASVIAQEGAIQLEGRVYSIDGDVASVHVSNKATQRGTITDVDGFFQITASVNDTLVFSAVQFKRIELQITPEIMASGHLIVPMKASLTLLDEVVVRPYNLSGDLSRDMGNLKIEAVITASTLGLPNAYVKVKSQNERRLFEADNGKFIYLGNYSLDSTFNPMIMVNLNKILNRITGRTQLLKRYVARDEEIALLKKVRNFYPDSIVVQELKIPSISLNEFFYFCENDSTFTSVAETDNPLLVWEFLSKKSKEYLSNNE